jgi:hypothetical protein
MAAVPRPGEALEVELVEVSLGTRPTDAQDRIRRLEREGSTHWLLRALARRRRVYASNEEVGAARHWLETSDAPLSARRHISNALVAKTVQLRAVWLDDRIPSLVVTREGRPFARVEYVSESTGWVVTFVADADSVSTGPVIIESLQAYAPEDFSASRDLRVMALDTALQVGISHLAHRPLRIEARRTDPTY